MLSAITRRVGNHLTHKTSCYKTGAEVGRSLSQENPQYFQQRRTITFVFSGQYGDMPCNHPIAGVFGKDAKADSEFCVNDQIIIVTSEKVTDQDGKTLGVGITKNPEAIEGIFGKPIGKDNKGEDRYLSDEGSLFDVEKWHSKTHYRPRSTEEKAAIEINLIKDKNCLQHHAKLCEEFLKKYPQLFLLKPLLFLLP